MAYTVDLALSKRITCLVQVCTYTLVPTHLFVSLVHTCTYTHVRQSRAHLYIHTCLHTCTYTYFRQSRSHLYVHTCSSVSRTLVRTHLFVSLSHTSQVARRTPPAANKLLVCFCIVCGMKKRIPLKMCILSRSVELNFLCVFYLSLY